MSLARPLKVVLYAALIGLLLASYVTPLQDIVSGRASVSELDAQVRRLEANNVTQRRVVEELNTPEGVERAARERYGMVRPGERIYIVEE
jgi:cell division protein FtsB